MPTDTPTLIPRKCFVVRPWHSPKCSLYPHIMDGVEYVDQVIEVIAEALDQNQYETRVDKDVFVPGLTVRENLERELTNADLVVVILDGLRPNVTYEMGFACGRVRDRRVLCLLEEHATVLVRNYYPDPRAIPTDMGSRVTVINPLVSIPDTFSDNADLLLMRYSRLRLASLRADLTRFIEKRERPDEKEEASSATAAEQSDTEPPDVWTLYREARYDELLRKTQGATEPRVLKARALSFMKTGRMYEAAAIWRQLLETGAEMAGAHFHLGICRYVNREFDSALGCFLQAKAAGRTDDVDSWIERTKRRLSARTPEPSPQGITSSGA